MNNIKTMSKIDLQYGDSLVFKNGLTFRQPLVMDIKTLGEDCYFWFMSLFMKNQYDMIHQLYEVGIDYESITKDELFKMLVGENIKLFCTLFEYFTNAKDVMYVFIDEYEQETICYKLDENPQYFAVDFDIFDSICKYITDIHFFKHSKIRKFSDDETKKEILKYEIEEMKFFNKNKENEGFSNIISSLVRVNHRTWEYVFGLTVYRLYDELYRAVKDKEVQQLISGVYTGNIDGKKLKSELDWTGNIL